MSASLVPPFKLTFVDINGSPLVGGTVGMYVPNTLTPANTWQDSGQTILNTNPIVLDSRGQCTIYGAGSYRQIVSDSLGNVIWDGEITDFQASVFGPQDSIAAATTTDLGTLASNNGLITGAATINSFGESASLANPIYIIQFSGINTLTYNATNMVLPGAANITTAAGDSALVEVTNAVSGYWRMIAYFPGSAANSFGTAAFKNIGTSGANVPLLNGNNIWSGSQAFPGQVYSVSIGLTPVAGAVTPDFSQANNFVAILGVSLTLNNPINVQQGQSGTIRIQQNAGSLTITWGSAFKASGGIANVNLSGINGAIDYFAYFVQGPTEIVITPILNIS